MGGKNGHGKKYGEETATRDIVADYCGKGQRAAKAKEVGPARLNHSDAFFDVDAHRVPLVFERRPPMQQG